MSRLGTSGRRRQRLRRSSLVHLRHSWWGVLVILGMSMSSSLRSACPWPLHPKQTNVHFENIGEHGNQVASINGRHDIEQSFVRQRLQQHAAHWAAMPNRQSLCCKIWAQAWRLTLKPYSNFSFMHVHFVCVWGSLFSLCRHHLNGWQACASGIWKSTSTNPAEASS